METNILNHTVLKTEFSVIYSSTDITEEVAQDLLALTYTDVIDDEGDRLSITLKDDTGKWAGAWLPDRGASCSAFIYTGDIGHLATGEMTVETLRAQGMPRTFELSAVSIPLKNTIRRTLKTRNFEGLKLSAIAGTIAKDNGLTLLFDSEEDPTYDRTDQNRETDLVFLKRLCDEAGLTVKVSANQLILFDQKSYEKKTPVATYTLGQDKILSYSFESQRGEQYRACTVRWRNVRKKTVSSTVQTTATLATTVTDDDYAGLDQDGVWQGSSDTAKTGTQKGATSKKAEYIDFTYIDETVDESGQTYVLKKRATSQAEAERLAKAKLRQLNLHETTASLTVVGDCTLYAGCVIALANFGGYDGNFIIEKATHSLSSSGYTTTLDLRRINVNY